MSGLRVTGDCSQHELIDQPESVRLLLTEADALPDGLVGLVGSFSLPGWKFQTRSTVCSFSSVLTQIGRRYVETCSHTA